MVESLIMDDSLRTFIVKSSQKYGLIARSTRMRFYVFLFVHFCIIFLSFICCFLKTGNVHHGISRVQMKKCSNIQESFDDRFNRIW